MKLQHRLQHFQHHFRLFLRFDSPIVYGLRPRSSLFRAQVRFGNMLSLARNVFLVCPYHVHQYTIRPFILLKNCNSMSMAAGEKVFKLSFNLAYLLAF